MRRTVDQLWSEIGDVALHPLKRARACADLRMKLKTLERQIASEARDNGRTWAEIGAVLEITRQAAQQRLG